MCACVRTHVCVCARACACVLCVCICVRVCARLCVVCVWCTPVWVGVCVCVRHKLLRGFVWWWADAETYLHACVCCVCASTWHYCVVVVCVRVLVCDVGV